MPMTSYLSLDLSLNAPAEMGGPSSGGGAGPVKMSTSQMLWGRAVVGEQLKRKRKTARIEEERLIFVGGSALRQHGQPYLFETDEPPGRGGHEAPYGMEESDHGGRSIWP